MIGRPGFGCAIVAVAIGPATATATAMPLATAAAPDEIPAAKAGPVDFARDVRPIFEARCVSCHGPKAQKGGLRLDRGDAATAGGEDAAILPGRGAESPVVRRAAGVEADGVMPPTGDRLTPEQVGTLRAWIDRGADWPAGAESGPADDRRDWWSLRPIARPAVPALGPADAARSRGPIDAFLLAKIREVGLEPAPEADRRTLIRRVSFDLTGLPPTPGEVDAFVADPAADAYDRLVDRLLASPRYGERWARHWLDVVHYGDSHGYDKDQPRPNAWPYRDYVIRAFNDDIPYARFVSEQLAGDVVAPGTRDGATALGFLAAGPWDLIGHAEVPESKVDGKIARHLDRDDMVAVTMNTFASLTVQCAQCHDHKFDPIRQEDYYRAQAVFAALDRADRPYDDDPAAATRAAALASARARLAGRRDAIEARLGEAGGAELAELDRRIAAARRPAEPGPAFGYHSAIEPAADRPKWVQVDLGGPVELSRVVLWPAHDDFGGIGAGFGFPARYRVDASDDPDFRSGVSAIADRTAADAPGPGIAPLPFDARGVRARYVRVSATRLARRLGDHNFALAELEAIDAQGRNRAAGAPASALDSIEAPPRWRAANLTDGYAPGRRSDGDDAGRLAEARGALVGRLLGADGVRDLDAARRELAAIEGQVAASPPRGLVYAGTVYDGGAAAFRGTGPDGGRPRPIYVLRRGDVRQPGREVGPGAPEVSEECPGAFDLPPGHPERDRRAALARWLVDRRNPLTWRSIVNRVWQYHFGRALAATPSDFGRMGQPPSHPELLDWLAADFRDGGQSIKRLSRAIVTSAAYRRSSVADARAREADGEDVYLARMPRRKLEAEAIRDAALAVAGTLDQTMYGPPFRDFAVDRPEHSPHYEYAAHDPDDPAARRRSIYRFLVRSRPEPLMAALDCADPSMQVDRRNQTLSPLQALALYNDGLILASSRHMARRVESAGDAPAQVSAAFRLALGRWPTDAERDGLADYARARGLAGACRLILNLNEFVFVD